MASSNRTKKSRRTIALAGATGFVGRHVLARLLEEDDLDVRCLIRDSAQQESVGNSGGRISFHVGDLTRPESLGGLMEGSWGFVNLAGYRDFWMRDRRDYYRLNEEGAANAFRAALHAKVKKVVQVSTPLAFGIPAQLPFNEETTAGPHPSDYARSKYRGDRIAWRLLQEEGLPVTIVYLAAVIGAGDPRPTMEVRRAVEKRLPALVGSQTTYTYLHVLDAAEAITRALLHGKSVGRTYLVGGERATTREYFRMIGELADVPVPWLDLPESVLIPIARGLEVLSGWTAGRRPILPLDILKTTAAGSLLFEDRRARKELGMTYRSLREALTESVEEIRSA
jgi:dihydroflavonol-4-reductase